MNTASGPAMEKTCRYERHTCAARQDRAKSHASPLLNKTIDRKADVVACAAPFCYFEVGFADSSPHADPAPSPRPLHLPARSSSPSSPPSASLSSTPFVYQLTSLRYTTSMSEKCTWWPVRRMRATSSTLAHTCSRDGIKSIASTQEQEYNLYCVNVVYSP